MFPPKNLSPNQPDTDRRSPCASAMPKHHFRPNSLTARFPTRRQKIRGADSLFQLGLSDLSYFRSQFTLTAPAVNTVFWFFSAAVAFNKLRQFTKVETGVNKNFCLFRDRLVTASNFYFAKNVRERIAGFRNSARVF